MIPAAIIAAAVALIGSLIAAGQEAEAAKVRQGIADKYGSEALPVLDKVVAQKLPPDAADRYTAATKATDAQGEVLGKYMEEVNAKGETADDRAAYLRMQQEAGAISNAAQSGVQREMANRGLAGSGMSFAMQQAGAQGAANRANQMGIGAAADARGRYMQALGAAGQMGGQMRAQELAGMNAVDAINEFNARQQSDADFRNQQIPQQQFDNRMSKLAGQSNALAGVASGYERGAQGTRQTAGGIGQAAITAGAAYDQHGNPVNKKKDYLESSGSTTYDENGNPNGGQDW